MDLQFIETAITVPQCCSWNYKVDYTLNEDATYCCYRVGVGGSSQAIDCSVCGWRVWTRNTNLIFRI